MTIFTIRLFFIIIGAVVSYNIGLWFGEYNRMVAFKFALGGIIFTFLIIAIESLMKKASARNLSAAVFGLIFGVFMAWVVTGVIKLIPMDETLFASIQVGLTIVFSYLGMVIAIRGKDEFNIVIPYIKFARQDEAKEIVLVDTSVIIDGRIADIFKTRFVEGRILIPKFVLRELQQIADSKDSLKRNRGRRGLDVLNAIQKDTKIEVKIHDEDFPELTEVDAKLVKLAQMLGAKILTNDYNLNKVAELQKVKVLNINDLANALKPVVLPGEELEVRIIKEGKEQKQGIAYLDDGTMVVVENTKHLLGEDVKVVVTSVLQTSAGKMIFGKLGSIVNKENHK